MGLALYRVFGRKFFPPGRPGDITGDTQAPHPTVTSWGEGISDKIVCLPLPRLSGSMSLEEALRRRRSVRDYLSSPLSIDELSQLLWAAYGVTETSWLFKTTPSAGATYPLDIYIVVRERGVYLGNNAYLAPGSYKYNYRSHCIELVREGDLIDKLYEAALSQEWVRDAAINIVIFGVHERTTKRYGDRGVRYVWMEAGHASQNIYLQATALGLGTVAIGAFYDDEVKRTVGAREGEPLYIMPVGRADKLHDVTTEELRRLYEKHRS